jgi:uncharacterized protein
MSKPIAIVKSFYAALDRGDISSALATLHDELEWTEAERAPYYTGTWHSPEDVYDKLFVPLLRDWEGFSLTPHDFIGSGERVVSLGAYSGTFKAKGKAMTDPLAHAWIVRGARISRFIQYTDTIKIREAMS